ncbi:acylphosphatase [Marinimicrobium sp. ABcell2]|uniref:acylphosphatase n=1 Tax=Marinimicrobium sp. ABcell2 TaxID=3069751 RepID=UPI0027B43A36|nr:acylphosphatase [Marinimicrobium sp. ABcell2]MDQ2076112.1 acylphosphatase [Marinimicrobium sp. ABcell2]
MSECKHYRISGRVQRVSYRATTQAKAKELGLTGWVRNLPDGRVEAMACGSEQALQAFEGWLWQGPRRAQVTDVEAAEAEPEAWHDFVVR